MGMFDTILHQDPRLCCGNGHMLEDLQTKDLQDKPALDIFRLDGDRLVFEGSGDGYYADNPDVKPDAPTLLEDMRIRVYDFCPYGCKGKDHNALWEFLLTFRAGRLVKVQSANELADLGEPW